MLLLAAVLVFTAGFSGAGNIASADPSANDWYRLRVCESGNNYAINTGNGYYGAYQFDLSTWRSVGGTGYPHQSSPAVQDALALKLWQQRGWSPWACAGIVGLSGSPSDSPPTPTPPVGSVDVVSGNGLTATVAGWAVDPSSPSTSIDVHIYVNGAGVARTANKARPDVNGALGIYGQHGYIEQVALKPGGNTVCVYGIGTSSGNNALLACRTVTGVVAPVGYVDVMAVSGWNVTVNGWSLDPNSTSTSTPVHMYINGGFAAATSANLPRPDINSILGVAGQHGYSVSGAITRGANSVCVYVIGVTQGGNNALMQCGTVQGPVAPIGSLDAVTVVGSQVYVAGWAIDRNAPSSSIAVHVYVNSTGRAIDANKPRADVNSVMGVSGQHGYSTTVPLQAGSNQVCAYAIGVAGNNNSLIGCRGVQYNPQAIQQQALPPEAAARAAVPSADASSSVAVTPFSAAVTGASPASSATVSPAPPPTSAPAPTSAAPTSAPAPTTVAPSIPTTSAVPTAPSSTSAPVAVGSAPPSTVLTTPTAVPLAKGGIDRLVVTGTTATLTGWVAGQVTSPGGTALRVTVNGVTHDVLADTMRGDVTQADLAAKPLGFTDAITLTKGSNEVCVYEIDSGGGISTAPLACRTELVR